MFDSKYVNFEYGAIIFSNALTHKDVAAYHKRTLGEPLGAGFVSVHRSNSEAYCKVYGESVSLRLKPSDSDEAVLDKLLGLDK